MNTFSLLIEEIPRFKNVYISGKIANLIIKYGGQTLIDYWILNKTSSETYKHASDFFNDSMKLFNVEVEVTGLENLILKDATSNGAIICPNHVSNLDISALNYLDKRLYFGAKKELSYIPIFGSGIKALGMPIIDRSNREEAIKSLDIAVEMIKRENSRKDNEKPAYLVIFPEGTRSTTNDYVMGEFKKGAFALSLKSGLPIIPVSIYGGVELLPKGTFPPKPGKMLVNISQPVYPEVYFNPNMDESAKQDAINTMLSDTKYKIFIGLELLKKAYEKKGYFQNVKYS
jgi:1-acyl-sn-glycerol-3-phosphate acyltransferase